MDFRFTLTALLPAWLALSLWQARAGDKLPDEAAVRTFVASDDFTLNGWWQEMDLPSRPTPGSFTQLAWKPGPPAEFRMTVIFGRVLFGKGSLTEMEATATAGASGEITAAMVRFACEGLNENVKVHLTPAGTWSLDFFGTNPTATLTAKDLEEALTLCRSHSELSGEALADLIAAAGDMMRMADASQKISAAQLEDDGKKLAAWRVARPAGGGCLLSKANAKVLRWETGGGTAFRPSTETAAQALRERMKTTDDSPLEIATVEFAHLTFHNTDARLFARTKGQKAKATGKATEIQTGTDDPAPHSDGQEELTAYAKADAIVVAHTRFLEVIRDMENRPGRDGTDSLRDARVAAESVRRILPRDFDVPPAKALACLEAGRGDIVSLTRVVVEVCRHLGMATREVHGFIVHPDCQPVIVERHCWLEVLDEGEWTALDPWMKGRLDEENAEWVVPMISGLHVRVCHGPPSEAQEKFLNSRPAVTIVVADGEPAERIEWPEGELRRIIQEGRQNLIRPQLRER